ncbi:MAG: type I secretion C-terminal target domain-containing protein [Defluviicoccus sp.]|nr:MAG: type I secretion C-terminal target domain-containing protein [Defluviicoccus sp.]
MTGSSSNDRIYGTTFGDAINGATGNDTLTSGAGNDVMNGGTGSDLLIGGVGKDRSTGGDGGDRFIFDEYVELGVGSSRDVIRDFSKAQRDMIDLSDLDAQPSASGSQGFIFIGTTAFSINTPGQVHYYASGGATIVELNTDADKAAEYQIELAGTIGLSASDFYL